MTPEQKQQVLELRASFLQEQEQHQTQWRLLCQGMKQVCYSGNLVHNKYT